MNIEDVNDDIKIPDNVWPEIFKHQWELAQKYKEIEGMGDLFETLKTNLDTAKGQSYIKDFAWRTTEELTEAHEAYLGKHTIHFHEELIDALHFLVELTIITGIGQHTPIRKLDYKLEKLWDIVYELGLACNCLKNKPWKQTQMLTDRKKFYMHLENVWSIFIGFLYLQGLKDEDIYRLYFKKNTVNKFRIKSKY